TKRLVTKKEAESPEFAGYKEGDEIPVSESEIRREVWAPRGELKGVTIAARDLRKLSFFKVNFNGAVLATKKEDGGHGTGADFSGSDLSDADFTNAILHNAIFSASTKLPGAKFVNAKLTGAKFTSAFLNHADFSGADLSNADLSYASGRFVKFNDD